jgi:hypothetical protein
MENMFDKATDLDPQPEFPLRTQHVFYQQPDQPIGELQDQVIVDQVSAIAPAGHVAGSNSPPLATLFILWIFGLLVWCMYYVNSKGTGKSQGRKKGGHKDV